jgi:hypothetical protein
MTCDLGHEPDFICEDCGVAVFVVGKWDQVPVCGACRFIRETPDMDEETKRLLRGEDL